VRNALVSTRTLGLSRNASINFGVSSSSQAPEAGCLVRLVDALDGPELVGELGAKFPRRSSGIIASRGAVCGTPAAAGTAHHEWES
jgi:hypothetical protein